MLTEVLYLLNVKKGGIYFDGTLGGGSYSKVIAEKIGSQGFLLSTDMDPRAIDNFLKNDLDNVLTVNDNFANLKEIVLENNKKGIKFDGMVLDLGLSSAQLDDRERGFSFLGESSLDMSFGPSSPNDTFYIVNNYLKSDLERIIKDYGEEPWSKRIAEYIVDYRKKRKINSPRELAEIIASAIPRRFWSKKIHPATKSFQAFRIETNEELNNLKNFLDLSIDFLKSGGRLVIVSFHSLEDRIVKNFFRDLSKKEISPIKILTKKPLKASEEELQSNYRSRSAILRAIEKI